MPTLLGSPHTGRSLPCMQALCASAQGFSYRPTSPRLVCHTRDLSTNQTRPFRGRGSLTCALLFAVHYTWGRACRPVLYPHAHTWLGKSSRALSQEIQEFPSCPFHQWLPISPNSCVLCLTFYMSTSQKPSLTGRLSQQRLISSFPLR